MGLTWIGSVVSTNFYLRANSAGWHQALKLALVPVLVLWQYVFFYIKTAHRELLTLVPIILGVAMLVIDNFTPTTFNILSGSVWLLSAAAFQTLVRSKSQEHDMSPIQLLHNNALICFLLLFPFSTVIDFALVGSWVFMDNFQRSFFCYALATVFLTIILNMSCFWIIVLRGPIAFQVVGYLKMVLFFIGGELMLRKSGTWIKILASLIALGGIFVYTLVKEDLEVQVPRYKIVELSGLDQELGELDESSGQIVELDISESDELLLGMSARKVA